MGAAGSHLTRYIRRFNVINRTERIINEEKPKVAPLYKVDAERLKKLMEDNPGLIEELKNKNSTLEKNLQSVYVKSKGDLPNNQSKAKLPQNREQVFNFGFLVEDPESVPPGRYTLTQITECIADHYKDKQIYTAEILAKRVKIDVKLMENILKYYRIFDMHIPPKMLKKNEEFSIGSTIDKIRTSFEIDKYTEEQKKIGKN
ncbi:NADH dehydrogenase [ubiquinone] 1 alpha subcomplex assembly factor 4 [Cinara cedri]|uniref:NADH dehydrogenase [ubiquinone] 1 alpha subcomplex assembly factor 4 n=1 Tax=Cinara cedri TaxID=506608 RepID=A0A5E4N847_9HEMI|nr:NADH dehydrogenase [ubiquinone] 1 alpha subcomplex assembly factor 4 [Cinara cedri]